jgi:hypothetical protein
MPPYAGPGVAARNREISPGVIHNGRQVLPRQANRRLKSNVNPARRFIPVCIAAMWSRGVRRITTRLAIRNSISADVPHQA